ncbi:MAG: hypothetical protein E7254_11785 [Lachnospiraceae bacterium]|nr:hypothetical protein [Lachnospiraceae bacterium]
MRLTRLFAVSFSALALTLCISFAGGTSVKASTGDYVQNPWAAYFLSLSQNNSETNYDEEDGDRIANPFHFEDDDEKEDGDRVANPFHF